MIKEVVDLLKLLCPPHPLDNGDRELVEKYQMYEHRVRQWRWTCFWWTSANTALIAGHVMLACGYLAFFFPGFALASEQKQQQTQIQALRIEQLSARLFNLRRDQCESIEAGKSGRAYAEQFDYLMLKYRELTGDQYRLADCREL